MTKKFEIGAFGILELQFRGAQHVLSEVIPILGDACRILSGPEAPRLTLATSTVHRHTLLCLCWPALLFAASHLLIQLSTFWG